MAKKPANHNWTRNDFIDWDLEFNDDLKTLINDNGRNNLTDEQRQLVDRNKELLEDKEEWNQKVQKLEEIFPSLKDRFHIWLQEVSFNFFLDCSGITIPCKINFLQCEFYGGVSFENVIFEKDTVFKGGEIGLETYGQIANFANVKFNGNVLFTDITLNNGITFLRVKFDGDAQLYFAKLDSHVLLRNANVEGGFELTCENKIKIRANGLTIKKSLYIEAKASIGDFRKLTVKGTADFSKCEFGSVPDFTDSKFDRAPEVAGMIVPSPDMNNFRWFRFSKSKNKSAVAKYRKLKAMALAANDHEKDGEFFAYEMMAKRGHETTGFIPLLLNSFYWLLSFYGQSIARPCWAMISSWFVFWLLAIGLTTPQMGTVRAFSFSALHSLLNTVPLIGGLFRSAAMPKGHEIWYDKTYHELVHKGFSADYLTALSAVLQFLGIIFLFLLILGLRNKFRLN